MDLIASVEKEIRDLKFNPKYIAVLKKDNIKNPNYIKYQNKLKLLESKKQQILETEERRKILEVIQIDTDPAFLTLDKLREIYAHQTTPKNMPLKPVDVMSHNLTRKKHEILAQKPIQKEPIKLNSVIKPKEEPEPEPEMERLPITYDNIPESLDDLLSTYF